MWIMTEKGDLRNLSYAYKIESGERYGKMIVQAAFPICTADPAFIEVARLKTFDNAKDANVYIENLANLLNGDIPRENKNILGYAFNW